MKGAKASGGKRRGTSGAKRGTAHLPWAVSEAAVWFLSDQRAAPKYLARWEKKHDKGKAVTILAQQLARAVSSRLPRQGAVERETCFQPSGRSADEPAASLDNAGCPSKRRASRLHARRP